MKWTLIGGGVALILCIGWALTSMKGPSDVHTSKHGNSGETPERPRPVVDMFAAVAASDRGAPIQQSPAQQPPVQPQDAEHESAAEPEPQPRTAEELDFTFDTEAGGRELHDVEGAMERTVAAIDIRGVSLEDIECRSTLCRVTLLFDKGTSESQFMDRFLAPRERTPDTMLLDSMAGSIRKREQTEYGEVRTVLYLEKPIEPLAER